jgi:hypothetical protein
MVNVKSINAHRLDADLLAMCREIAGAAGSKFAADLEAYAFACRCAAIDPSKWNQTAKRLESRLRIVVTTGNLPKGYNVERK